MREVTISGNAVSVDGGNGSGVACITGGAEIVNVRKADNTIRKAAGAGIRASKGTGAMRRYDIHGNRILNSGQGGDAPGIMVNGVTELSVAGNRANRADGSAQTYGLDLESFTGNVMIANNDFSDNTLGGINNQPTPGSSVIIANNFT